MSVNDGDLFDVVEIEIRPPHKVRTMLVNKSAANADAAMNMAVLRRGVETHFYKVVPAGMYRDDHFWLPGNKPAGFE